MQSTWQKKNVRREKMAGKELRNKTLGTSSNAFLLEAGTSDDTSTVFSVTNTPIKRSASGNYVSNSVLAEQDYKVGKKSISLTAEQTEVVIDAVGDFKVSYAGDNREEVFVLAETDSQHSFKNL